MADISQIKLGSTTYDIKDAGSIQYKTIPVTSTSSWSGSSGAYYIASGVTSGNIISATIGNIALTIDGANLYSTTNTITGTVTVAYR